MNTPKILPWIARRSGVSEARAAALWADALQFAADRLGPVENSDYWKAAMDRWLSQIVAAQAASGHAGDGHADRPAAPAAQTDRPDRGPWAVDSRSRFRAERRRTATPLRVSCSIGVHFCLTHQTVSCGARASRGSGSIGVLHDSECRLTYRVLTLTPAEHAGGGR